MGERLLNHADAEQIATALELAADLTVGVNDLGASRFPSHNDGTRISTALNELKNTNALKAEYKFNTIADMNTAIQAGTVKDGATIYVKQNSGGGGGGHEIVDSEGTALPQRSTLQFMRATVTDDETNDATVVTPQGGYIVYPTFDVGNDGHLTATGGAGVDYEIDQYGHMIATPQ